MANFSKIFIVFLLSFVISLFIVFKENIINYRTNSLKDKFNRNLLTINDYSEICKETNYTQIIENKFTLKAGSTLSYYLKNFTYIKKDQSDNIYKLIVENDSSVVKTIVVDLLLPYLIFLVCSMISIIILTLLLICCCKGCLCCSFENEEEEPACGIHKASGIIIIVFLIGIIVICIVGFVFSSKIVKKSSDTVCSGFKMYIDVKSGQDIDTLPKWIGIKGIDNKLESIINSLDNLKENSKGVFDGVPNTKDSKLTYDNLLDNSYNGIKDKTTRNPNPNNSESSYIPGYIEVIS